MYQILNIVQKPKVKKDIFGKMFGSRFRNTYFCLRIAKNKSDKTKLNQTFYDLISINILMSILLCFILFISLNYSETLSQNKQLVYIGICKLLLNTFLVEWFYKGIENFKYITIRSFIVKCFSCHA